MQGGTYNAKAAVRQRGTGQPSAHNFGVCRSMALYYCQGFVRILEDAHVAATLYTRSTHTAKVAVGLVFSCF